MRAVIVTCCVGLLSVAVVPAQRGAARVLTDAQCAAPLGAGVKSNRVFCDVLIGVKPAESVAMTIPAHTGVTTLQFDLHNRFTIPALPLPGPLTFARHESVVTVIRPTGEVISQAAVVREFRTVTDLFDQISGGARPGGVKAVAPGPAEAVRVTLPTGLASVGIVGSRLKVATRANQEVFDTPGRPVAIVSNLRLQYRPKP
jgi:hypothetical protein